MSKKEFSPARSLYFIALILATIASRAQEAKWSGLSVDFAHGRLVVSPENRFLVFEDGTPFFWLGDTAWELFHRLSKKEAEQYLENRREKGFTVIQAVILAELDGLNAPNAEGEVPLVDHDPTRINEAYFAHVDWVIRKAREKGMPFIHRPDPFSADHQEFVCPGNGLYRGRTRSGLCDGLHSYRLGRRAGPGSLRLATGCRLVV